MPKLLNSQTQIMNSCVQDMYDNLSHKIELDASQKSNPCHGEFDIFSNTERTNHPTIIQVYNFNIVVH